jgi:ABC-type polysaccharide/polyol phosphate transport system ATPase subunit
MAHVSIKDAFVRYPVYTTARQRSLFSYAAHKASFGRVAREVGNIPVVEAVRGVSLELKDGDRIALIGRNGSGKTTMLKLCAGLVLPDEGSVVVQGSHAAVLNPAAGLDVDKSGAENVEQIGRLLSLSKAVRKRLLDDVAEFTELGDFLNLPVRIYSSGMVVRLLFALATSVQRDVLIIDELIGAGDAHFVEKAAARVRQMFERARILILATHSGEIAASMCNRALWLDSGKPIMTGPADTVWAAYLAQRPPLEAVA